MIPTLGILRTIPLSPPVNPDPDEARQLLEVELSKAEYQSGQSWFTTAVDAFTEWLSSLRVDMPTNSFHWVGAATGIALLLLVIFIILRVTRSMRNAGTTTNTPVIHEDDTRTSNEMRTEATRLASLGSFTEAVIEQFRAIARSAEERVLISIVPGRTAQEVAHALGARFAAPLDQSLANAAIVFDECAYGNRTAQRADYQAMADLDTSLRDTRPLSPQAPRSAPLAGVAS